MKTIYHARSNANGIIFYSNSIPDLMAESFVDKNGEIHSRIASQMLPSCLDISDSEDVQAAYLLTEEQLIILGIFLIALSILFHSVAITLAVTSFSLLCFPNLISFIESSLSFKFGAMQSVSKFHAAEHMSINAYCYLQRVPTLEEIKHFSRFNQDCGSMYLFRSLLSFLLISICMVFMETMNPITYVLLLISCPLLVLFLDKVGLLKFLQIFYTSKPTDLELKVAIKGLEKFEEMEEKIRKQCDTDYIHVSFFNN